MARHDLTHLAEARLREASPAASILSARVGSDLTGFQAPTLQAFDQYLRDNGYDPHAKQQLLHHQIEARFVAVCAGRRSGKTYGCAREFLRRVYRDVERKKGLGMTWQPPGGNLSNDSKPFCHYFCVSPNYGLGNLQRRELLEILGGVAGDLVLKYVQSKGFLWLRGGVLIEFKSGDRPDRLVGAGLDGVWDDESAREKPDLWEDSLRPALSDRNGWALFTTTPLGKNWFYDQIWTKTRGDSDYVGVTFATVDNIRVKGLAEEVDKARRELPRAVFLRNYEASFDAFQGKIFEAFLDDETHLVDSLPPLTARWAGVDWGFANPGTQVCVGADRFGSIFVWREDYCTHLTLSPPPNNPKADCWLNRFYDAERDGVDHWWADPAQPVNIQTCAEAGFDFQSADNNVSAGIDYLLALFQPARGTHDDAPLIPSLFIHKDCENLRRELLSYRWSEQHERPVKENDHAIDALRYAIFSEARRGTALSARDHLLKQNFPSLFSR